MLYQDKVVMIADGEPDALGRYYFSKNIKIAKKEIPVYLEFDEDRQVATAEVEIHDDKIYASFEIQDELVETMLKGGAKLTPCTGMVMSAVQEKFDPEKDTAHLIRIGLCKSGNVDGRIPPL